MAIKTETVSIKVSAEEKAIIKELAAKEDISTSKLLYRVVAREILSKGE